MFKITYEYFIVFNKIVWSEKVPFVYSLVFPGIAFLLTNYKWIISTPTTSEILGSLNIYWAFIIFGVYLNGLGLQLSYFRESGFLKTSTMISGSKYPIFLGMAMTQFCFAFSSLTIFTVIIGLLVQANVLLLLFIAYTTLFITSLPIIFFMSWIPVVPARQNTINTISNIILLPMVFITAIRPLTNNIMIESLFSLLPTDYISQVSIFLKRLVLNESVNFSSISIVIGSLVYIVLGSIFIGRIRLISSLSRN